VLPVLTIGVEFQPLVAVIIAPVGLAYVEIATLRSQWRDGDGLTYQRRMQWRGGEECNSPSVRLFVPVSYLFRTDLLLR